MKLLFDQNLSPRLVMKLADHYPDSAHVMTHALDHALDETVWAFAREHGYTKVASLIEVGAELIGDLSGRENVFLNGAILGDTPTRHQLTPIR